MKIAVFGASGAIGRHFVQQALKEGHYLHLYSRKNANLPESRNCQVFMGELSDYIQIKKAIIGTDAVVSLLGPVMIHLSGLLIITMC
jgi:putative NADH-flavin reductase